MQVPVPCFILPPLRAGLFLESFPYKPLFYVRLRNEHHYIVSPILEYVLKFFREILSPKRDGSKFVVEYGDPPTLE